jgi:uncharacterized membrane-anchored protein
MTFSARAILVVPLIGLAMYMAYAGIVRGDLLAWGDAWPDRWYGHSATLGGLGWLCLAGFLATALLPTNQTARMRSLTVVGGICLALFFLLEIVSALLALR